jgi:hypothetical protein
MWAVWLMIGMVIGSFLAAAMLAIFNMVRDDEEFATEAKVVTVSGRPPEVRAATLWRAASYRHRDPHSSRMGAHLTHQRGEDIQGDSQKPVERPFRRGAIHLAPRHFNAWVDSPRPRNGASRTRA